MKGLYRVYLANGRALISRNVFIQRQFNVATKASLTMSARRYQSDTPEEVKAQWTSYPLAPSTPPVDDSSELSQSSVKPPEKHIAYIAFGSNLGDRIKWIEKALNLMPKRGIKVKRTSSLWETEPMYVVDQASFVNGVCEVSD
jgi:2-amino-4-hydroxy-6-hydroxymethyldihydropteridine diphosphokinase / dihydropteroate synthase